MGSTPYWVGSDADETAWAACWLGDDYLPGRSIVTADGPRYEVDVQKGKSADGARLKDVGFQPGTCTIELTIFTREQWEAWLQVLPRISPSKPGGIRRPLQIVHPEPNLVGIQTVVITKIKGQPPTAKGGKVYTIDCLQWFPSVKATKPTAKPATKDLTKESFKGTPLIPPAIDLT
jgi:hypothetical protein